MKRVSMGLIIALSITTLTACSDKEYYKPAETKVTPSAYTENIKNKLYYIPHEFGESDFPAKYEKFLNDHPDLEVISVESDPSEQSHNAIDGTFIFTKLKQE